MKILAPLILTAFLALSVFAQRAVVIKPTANFYTKPSIKSKVIFSVKKGASFKLENTDSQHGWYYVSVVGGNVKGWIQGNDIKLIGVEKWPDLTKAAVKDEWQLIDTMEESDNLFVFRYFNPAKAVREGDIVRFWIKGEPINKEAHVRYYYKTVLDIPIPNDVTPSKFLFDLWYVEANCRLRLLHFAKSLSNWSDRAPIIDTMNPSFYPVVPDSYGETVFNAACGK